MKGELGPFGMFHVLDRGVHHKLLEDKLHADVTEHDVTIRVHSPNGPTDQANFLPTVSLLQELHEDGMNGVARAGANHIVQLSMLCNKALRR